MFFHKAKDGETTLDGHVWLAEKNNLNFQAYIKEAFTQEGSGFTNDTKLHLRTLHPNFIFSLGVETFNLVSLLHRKEGSCCSIPNVSFWGLGGHKVDPKLSLWGGLGLSFNPAKRNVENIRFLAAGNHSGSRVKAAVEATYTRTDGVDNKSLWIPSGKLHFDAQGLVRNNRQLASIEWDQGKKKFEWNVVNETQVDNATRLKVRINHDRVLSTALIHSYSNQANFALTANVYNNLTLDLSTSCF